MERSVIPSRADGEESHRAHSGACAKHLASSACAELGRKLIGIATVRSLAVCAARDDTARVAILYPPSSILASLPAINLTQDDLT